MGLVSVILLFAWIISSDMFDMIYLQVYLGEKYVNNPTLSDITFLVEGGDYSFACPFL